MKRKIAYIGFAFLGGLLAASLGWGKYNLPLILIGMLLTSALFFILKKYRLYVTVIAVSFFVGVSYLSVFTYFKYDKIISYSGENIIFSGVITDYSYFGSDMGRLTVKGRINDGVKTEITFFVDDDDYDYYDKVEVKGKVEKINDSVNFASESYYRPKGVFLSGIGKGQVCIIEKNTKPFLKAVKKYRDYLFNEINYIVKGDEGGFLGAMLCGDKSEISSITKTKLYRTGIGHIFSVSGTHMVIISAFFGAFFGLFVKNRKIRFVLMEIIIWTFALFAGFSPSVTRAAIMLTMLLLSDVLFRFGDCMNTLGWCALIMPLSNPYIVRSPSFLLSFFGAMAIGAVAPRVINVVQYKKATGKLLKSGLASLTVMFTAMPVTVLFFDEISIIAPLANVILVPICTLALSLSVIVAVTGGLSFVAVPILKTAGWLIHWVILIADKISSLDYSYVTVNSMYLKIVISFICAAVIIWAVHSKRLKYYVFSAVIAYGVIISAYNVSVIYDANNVHFIFIPDGSKSQVVVYENEKCVIADLGAKGSSNSAVNNLMTKKGVKYVESVIILDECYYTAKTYENNIYPEATAFYSDFDTETDLYKTSDIIYFENIKISSIDEGYEASLNNAEIEMFSDCFILNDKKYNLKNEKYPIEIVFENNDYIVRRLDYGFNEQCRLG
ncbi:MAG: ComEC/Rec2 family competence protein [Ruminococcus sp.]|nr:ComEC/Rec2 family competence protein [Ruminococcus sp.]